MPDLRKPYQTPPAASQRSDQGTLVFAIACASIAAALAFADYLPQRASIAIVAALAMGLLAALIVYVLHGLIDAPLYASQRTYILTAGVFGAAAALSEYLLLGER